MTTACCLLLLTGAVLLICLLLFALLLLPLLLVAAIADWADDDDDDSSPFILPDASTCCHSSLPLARRSSSCQSSRSKHSVTSCANISWVLTKSCERSVHVDLMRLNTASLVLPAPFVMEVLLSPPPFLSSFTSFCARVCPFSAALLPVARSLACFEYV